MRNIKGPKSALTDFIEESGIEVRKRNIKRAENEESSDNKAERTENEKSRILKKSKVKKIRNSKPLEIGNLDFQVKSLEEMCIENVLANPENFQFTDKRLNLISMYLCRKRRMCLEYFNFLMEKCTESISIYDCSMIKDSDFYIKKNLKRVELFLCGQITEVTLNEMLRDNDSIEVLRITGAYLIEKFNLPPTLKVLDLTNCSRIENTIITNINDTYKKLEELKLSYCYNLTDEVPLQIEVERLFICESKLSEKFYKNSKNLKNMKALSVRRCAKINSLPKFTKIEYLDIDGLVELDNLSLPDTIKYLNASYCYNLKKFNYKNLEYLNVSKVGLSVQDLREIAELKSLKTLDLSWNNELTDDILKYLVDNLNLHEFIVFGCFALTAKSAGLAWQIRNKVRIVGNPAETTYLLNYNQ
jgi:Leucine Rich repeat